MVFKSELDRMIEIIDINLRKTLENKGVHQKKIFEVIEYSLFTGGKRLRPAMTLKSAELFSGEVDKAIPFAMAIEMIHTYSLIHDDLPAMDDDDFRRDKPTSHKVYGEGMAILAGDGLLNLAFETVLNSIDGNIGNKELGIKYSRGLREIGNYAGLYGMIGGQVVDLMSDKEGAEMTKEKLIFMYETKTAALIQASLVSGAIIGGATDKEVEIMRDFGYNLGIAYQIRDDILDKDEDEKIGKLTYLSFFGLEESLNAVELYSSRAKEDLKKLKGKDIEFLKEMTDSLVNRKK